MRDLRLASLEVMEEPGLCNLESCKDSCAMKAAGIRKLAMAPYECSVVPGCLVMAGRVLSPSMSAGPDHHDLVDTRPVDRPWWLPVRVLG